jgi:hypothetical protein
MTMESQSTDNPVLRELREQTKWLRFLGLRELPAILSAQLKDDTQRQAYELSDGTRSTRMIADAVDVSAKTISNWWQRWVSAGIATADETGRATRLVSLKSVGIETSRIGQGSAKGDEPDE